jgi:NACHT domain
VALVLLLLPWAWVLRHHHLDSGAVGTVVSVSLGLPALYLGVVGYLAAVRPARVSELTIVQVADQLAVAVGAQWEAEARIRRLNDPWPLPVSWTAADASLTDPWDLLERLARSGAGQPAPPPAGTWAVGPDDLAGEGAELVEVLARVPTGRLVVLGEPGAGKTMLMVRLVLDLLARRAGGGPVPFLASVASWNPATQDLHSWLGAQLLVDHPALASPPPTDRTESNQAAALLAGGMILPVLDGLDEIPEQVRGPAISRINDALRPGEQVVVTCRSQQYRDAVRPPGGIEVTLRAAAAVQLRSLDADAVRDYLCADAAGPVARARWAPVLAVIGTATSAGRALSTPLMVGLARAIYNPRPGELTGALHDPAELCKLPDQQAVEFRLFDAFIPAAYRQDPAGRWKAQDAERWLAFLARHLERTIGGPDLAWWQLPLAVPPRRLWALAGVVAGVVAGIVAGVVAWIVAGIVAGIVLWIVVWAGTVYLDMVLLIGMLSALRAPAPTPGIRLQSSRWGIIIGAGVVAGIVAGVIAVAVAGRGAGIVIGWVAAFTVGLGSWSTIQERTPLDIGSAASPPALLARDRRAAMVVWVVTGFAAAGAAALVFVAGSWPRIAALAWVGGIAAGWVLVSFVSVRAWPSYGLARVWLALHHRLPWPLMGFLTDAHRRGVLRQAGAVYQFRHIELQHRLAARDGDEGQAGPSSPPDP